MAIDLKRRRAVMARSIKLGHCVCDPRKPCPCEPFKNDNVCACAGERPAPPGGPVRLTQFVRKAGCASKIGQADLQKVLSGLPAVTDPNVLVGTAAGDDAGVYRLDDRQALVQTVDVFTPCVDDPYLFGQIAAANSVSDVYAMGGKPLTALSIIGFPIDELDGRIMEDILRGERVREYVVEGHVDGRWRELCRGTAIGHKKIDRIEPVTVARIRLRITQAAAPPLIRKLAVYSIS